MENKIKNLVSHHDLIITLAMKELKVKFKGAALGFLWSLLSPLLMMLILTVVFTIVFRLNIEKYSLFILCGLLPWNFFSLSLAQSTGSIIFNAPLIKKVPLPREIFPLSIVLANLVNFLIAMVLLLVFLAIFNVRLSFAIFILPIVILAQVVFTAGMCLFFSCITVFFRDLNHVISIFLMLWFYLTPVFYPIEMVPPKFLRLYLLNPIAAFAHNYREILLQGKIPNLSYFIPALCVAIIVFLIGYLTFIHYEDVFGELV